LYASSAFECNKSEAERNLAKQRGFALQCRQQRVRLCRLAGRERLARALDADAEIENAPMRLPGDFARIVEFRCARCTIAADICAPRTGEEKRGALLVGNVRI